jgi:hypothetical protein
MMQYMIELLNNLCLKKGVSLSIAFTKPDKDFHDFFEQYFVSILPHVIRYKLYCGFLPWVIHKHPLTGDKMPMLLPMGSFHWHVRTKSSFSSKENKRNSKKRKPSSWDMSGINDNNIDDQANNNLDYNCASEYVVQCTGDMGIDTCNINVINLIDPMLVSNNMCPSQLDGNSIGQVMYSPLYVALQKYLALDTSRNSGGVMQTTGIQPLDSLRQRHHRLHRTSVLDVTKSHTARHGSNRPRCPRGSSHTTT